jgi:fused signal recognition particle receptor
MSGWFQKLKSSLSKTSSKIVDGLTSLVLKRKLDQSVLDELEEILIMADLGIDVSREMILKLKSVKFDQEITLDEIKMFLAKEMTLILESVQIPFNLTQDHTPHILMMVGVNGAGKTTTVAKLCQRFKDQHKTIKCIAGDTFRAAGSDQLDVWGKRIGIEVISGDSGTDPASLVYRGVESAIAAKDDILIVDTAGRLQNNVGLMDELAKIQRVIQKLDPTGPHEVLLVLDATVGQNAYSQVELFSKVVKVSGLIIAKMDSSAKGGVIVGLARKFKIPIYFMGLGEKAQDLEEFNAREFAYGLLEISEEDGVKT